MGIRMYHKFIAICVLIIVPLSPAWAARQYRCSGKVQYRPCDVPLGKGQLASTRIGSTLGSTNGTDSRGSASRLSSPSVSGELYAKVLENSFLGPGARAPKAKITTGTWKGLVEGNGMVHLFLEILRGEAVEERRFMGNVLLHGKATTFAFVSPLPHGKDWTWRVSAISKNL